MKIRVLESDNSWPLRAAGEEVSHQGPLRKSLAQILNCEIGGTAKADDRMGRTIVLVSPGSEKTWLRDLLYNVEALEVVKPHQSEVPFYIVLRCQDERRDDTYEGLVYELEKQYLAAGINLGDKIGNELARMLAKIGGAKDRPQKMLREVLDTTLPGGIEGLAEIGYRPSSSLLHSIIRYQKKSRFQCWGAFSLALGAAMSGDLSAATFARLSRNLIPSGSMEPSGEPGSAVYGRLFCHVEEAQRQLESSDVEKSMRVPLAEYLRDRRVVIVEDKLAEDGWGAILGALSEPNHNEGEYASIRQIQDSQKMGGINWSWFDSIASLNKHLRASLSDLGNPTAGSGYTECDIILLDLSSSAENHSDGVVAPMLKGSLLELATLLREFRERLDPELHANSALEISESYKLPRHRSEYPVVVAFTATQTGMTTRTLLQDIDIADMFFKTTDGPMHQRMHYYSLRQTIISALTRRAAWISHSEPHSFRAWLSQFMPQQRPDVLRFMRHYRHYSASSLIRICRTAIRNKDWLDGNHNGERWFTYFGRVNKSGASTVGLLAKALDAEYRNNADRGDPRGRVEIRFLSSDELRAKCLVNQVEEHEIDKECWLRRFCWMIRAVLKSAKSLYQIRKKGAFLELLEENGHDSHRSSTPVVLSESQIVADKEHPQNRFPERIVFVDDYIGSGGQMSSYVNKFFCDAEHTTFLKGVQKFEVWYALGSDTSDLRALLGCSDPRIVAGKEYLVDLTKIEGMPTNVWPPAQPENRSKPKVLPEELRSRCLTVRIEEVIPSLDPEQDNLAMILGNKSLITGARKFELPCQFEPFGWKESCALVSTFTNVPGNTIPIIWANGHLNPWIPLKERFFNPFDSGQAEQAPPCVDSCCWECSLDSGLPLNESAEALSPSASGYIKAGHLDEDWRREYYEKLPCWKARRGSGRD